MSQEKFTLPKHAIERLQGMRKSGDSNGIFTSDLSVNEFVLLKDIGFEPLGLVMGSSVYHVGFQTRSWSKNQELTGLTQAMYEARELAIQRMEEEANTLFADGVVGVRLIINRSEWGNNNLEFVAIGTAVSSINRSANYRRQNGKPFTSDLSGQDFWALIKAGYRPLALTMGTCVYHIARQGLGKTLGRLGRNTELTHYTQALYDARELAMERMQKEAHDEKAEGIVGVRIDEGNYGWASHIIEYFSVGTAVIENNNIEKTNVVTSPDMVMLLNDLTK